MVWSNHRVRWTALGLCAALCVAYAVISWSATAQKSATADEPYHVAVSWLMLHNGDFRAAPDVPPLWEDFIGLPLGSNGLRPNTAVPAYGRLKTSFETFQFLFRMLYRTPGVDGIAVVQRARMLSVIPAVLLGVLVARWSWALAGPVAAVAGTLLWAMDPSMLGHGSLAKNDVAFALVYAWLAYSMWRAGQRLSWPWIVSLCLSVGLAIETKLSGLVTGPLLALVLLARALMFEPWPVLGWMLQTRWAKIGAAFVVCLLSAICCYIIVWGAYRFRYEAGPNGLQLDLNALVSELHNEQTFQANDYRPPTPGQWLQWTPDVSTSALIWAARHRFVPQAFIAGVLETRIGAIGRYAFLCDSVYLGGRWYYFPLALLFKEPLTTQALWLVTLSTAFVALRRRLSARPGSISFARDWSILAIVIPLSIYMLAALFSPLNLGIRYIFAIFPFLFVAGGIRAARLWEMGRAMRVVLGIAALTLTVESTAVYPNYISFFNVACGGSRGGIRLLADSNLDWGQDLPLLAQWQRDHPAEPLYLSYFGVCDPAVYGIRYTNVTPAFVFGPPAVWPVSGGVAAISATNLTGVYTSHMQSGPNASFATSFAGRAPFEVLGGSIYLFRFDPIPRARHDPGTGAGGS